MRNFQEIKIPIRVIKNISRSEPAREKIKAKNGRNFWPRNFSKIIYCSFFGICLVAAQSFLFSGYEAHVINVTAHICRYSETRTPGYWKTHEEVTRELLPQIVGDETVSDFERAFDILDSNAKDMRDKLMSHLLAMKLNIAYFGIGGYFVESEDKTINEIVAWADHLLSDGGTREEMEQVKNILDYLNNLHQLRYCSDLGQTSLAQTQAPAEEYFVIKGPAENEMMGDEEMFGVLQFINDETNEAGQEAGTPEEAADEATDNGEILSETGQTIEPTSGQADEQSAEQSTENTEQAPEQTTEPATEAQPTDQESAIETEIQEIVLDQIQLTEPVQTEPTNQESVPASEPAPATEPAPAPESAPAPAESAPAEATASF